MRASPIPLVAVIIPTYQSAATLPRAIESVLRQEFADFELIVVDDGSTDDARAVVERYAGDARVCYFYQSNQGLAGARNAGIARSVAPLIALLDADDEWLEGKLGVDVGLLQAFPDVGLVFSNSIDVSIVTNRRRDFSELHPQMKLLKMRPLGDDPNALLIDDETLVRSIFRKNFVHASSLVFRRERFDAVDGFTHGLIPEDIDFLVRLTPTTRFAYYQKPLAIRYRGPHGLSWMSERWLNSLVSYHRMTLTSPHYAALRDIARYNLRRTYRSLIVYYALRGRRSDALRAFRDSLGDVGLNARIAGLAALALFGPGPLKVIGRLTGRIERPNGPVRQKRG